MAALLFGVVLAGMGSMASARSAPEASPVASPVSTVAGLQKIQADELGVVPVMMYHAFTSDPSLVAEYVKTLDDLEGDLQWLYDHDFYVISVRSLLENRIDAPAGKHPVVLTFDDSTAGQFLLDQDAQGHYTPRAASAIGVLEAFFASHADFGHTAFFAVIPNYCFSDSEIEEVNAYATCDIKIAWLAAHGYEIGNHTFTHVNLGEATPDQFAEEVGGTAQWIDKRVTGPANMSHTLVLPYGGRPDPATNPKVFAMLQDGFWYEGQQIVLNGVFDVGSGPTYSPSSSWWDAGHIERINGAPASLDYWHGAFERGDVLLYTSDGNPDTVTMPDPVPTFLDNEFDPNLIPGSGKKLVRYDTAETSRTGNQGQDDGSKPDRFVVGAAVITSDDGVRLRSDPSTDADVAATCAKDQQLEIEDGPVEADGYIWWQVKTGNGTSGWVVDDFLKDASPTSDQ